GIEVRRMFGDVRREVREGTGGKQIPWENSALEGEFFFKPAAPVVEKPAPPPQTAELQQALKVAMRKAAPEMNQERLEGTVKSYLEDKGSKAQAISRDKNASWRVGARETAYSAEQGTLENCQIRYGSPCILVAVNDQVADLASDGSWVGGRTMSR